jgi:putative ABC transport system permease protein
MIIFEVLRLSLTALRANKVRSFLTMLGIIIGVAAVILLISLGTGLQNYITEQFESLGTDLLYVLPGQVGQEGASFSQGPPNFAGSKLSLKDARDLFRLGPPIVDASAVIEETASIKFGHTAKYSQVHGVMENFFKMTSMNMGEGRPLNKGDIEQQRKVAILGPSIKDKVFGDVQPIGQKILVGDTRYEVVGVAEKKGSSGLGSSFDDVTFVPLTTAQKQFNQENVMSIMIQVTDKQEIAEAKRITERFFLKRLKKDEFSVVDQASLLQTINSIIGVLTAALGGIAAISLLVGGIGIMNIMLVSVTERTREIGLRKAVGAKSSDILSQFLIEAVTLCLIGGAFGILIGAGGALIAQKFIPTTVPLWAVLLAFGFSAAVGIIFGVAPAYKAAKLDPINALRYE